MDSRLLTPSRIVCAIGLALMLSACGGGGNSGGSASFSVGGTVAGLILNNTLVLQNDGGDNKTVTANGAYTFATPVTSGKPYNVTVLIQPVNPPQTCTVANATGAMANSNVTNVTVTCL